jgi:hypothetical protein
LGLQIILLHDLREGRNMVWSSGGNHYVSAVDIRAQIDAALKANEDYRAR